MKRSRGIIVLALLLLGSIVYGFEKPDANTIWTNATPGNRLEPGGSKKNTGYIAGERPGFKTWNWLIYNLGLWTDYLDDVTSTLKVSTTGTDGHIGQTGDIGIGTSTPSAKVHIVSTGTGAAYQIDTTQQDKAIYVSSSGVVEIASSTVQNQTVEEQTVTNQTITDQSVDNLAINVLVTSPKSALVDVQEATTTLRTDLTKVQEATTTLKIQIDTKLDDAPNVVASTHIAPNAVDTSEINNSAVETVKINNDAVDKDKINSDVAGTGLEQDSDGSLEFEEYAAGDFLIQSSDSAEETASGTYVIGKEIQIRRNGTLRIKFSLRRAAPAGIDVYGRIYRNGSPVGIERNNTDDTPTEYSEDIAGWSEGDLCQLYAYKSGANNAEISLFRIYSDKFVKEEVTRTTF